MDCGGGAVVDVKDMAKVKEDVANVGGEVLRVLVTDDILRKVKQLDG